MGKGKFKSNIRVMEATKDNTSLDEVLSELEMMARGLGYKKLKLCMSSQIFKRFSASEFKSSAEEILQDIQIVLYFEPKIIFKDEEKRKLLKEFHNNPVLGGHCGQKRMLKKLKSSYTWKGMSKDVALFVKNCRKCQINKAKVRQHEEMVVTPTPQKAFDITCIDTIGPFMKTSQNNVYAVTIQCELTKYVVIVPIPNKEANTVAKAIIDHFILVYGPMRQIRTDMGTEYKNEVLQNLSKFLNIEHKFSTAYHSQTIGGCERNHRVLNEYLRSYINENKTDWDEWTRYFSFCYNTTPSTYHNYTPFELVYGRRAEILMSETCEIT